jgi:hypothetical protein
MRQITLTIIILVAIESFGHAQITGDKVKIYKLVIESFTDKNLPLINETITTIDKYDIDGDYNKWLYQTRSQMANDTSNGYIQITAICATPVQYTQSVLSYLSSQGISANTADFFYQADQRKLDSLDKYVSKERVVSWRRAPFRSSLFGNLFKKKRVTGLSTIVFNPSNKIALVKIQVYSKKRTQKENTSKIVILKKTDIDWTILGFLDQKLVPISKDL